MLRKYRDAVEVLSGSASKTTSENEGPHESQSAQVSEKMPEFKPTLMLRATMAMLGILTLAVALDATALAVALPVC